VSSEIVTIESIKSAYRRRGESLFRLALARTADPEIARDAVRNSFARAIRARAGFIGSASLEEWICRCVLNATAGSRPPAGEDEPREVNDAVWETAAFDARVRAAVHRLPAHERNVLVLRFYLDHDCLTIAETLGIEVETVSAKLQAARRNLNQALEEVAR